MNHWIFLFLIFAYLPLTHTNNRFVLDSSQSSVEKKPWRCSVQINNSNNTYNTPSSQSQILIPTSNPWNFKAMLKPALYGIATIGTSVYGIFYAYCWYLEHLLQDETKWWNWHGEVSTDTLQEIELTILWNELVTTIEQRFAQAISPTVMAVFAQEIDKEIEQLSSIISHYAYANQLPLDFVIQPYRTIAHTAHNNKKRLMIIKRTLEAYQMMHHSEQIA